MELAENIEYINEQLVRHYGKYDDHPNFRVVWSNDQFEKRWMSHTDEGFQLIHPEVREVPKYSAYIVDRYILERFVPVAEDSDLVSRTSYEPCWTFNNAETGEYIPPRFDMCQVIVESILSQTMSSRTFRKYKDPQVDPEYRKSLVDKMFKELFGNETDTVDALHYKEGIVNPAGQMEFHDQQNNSESVKSETENKVN